MVHIDKCLFQSSIVFSQHQQCQYDQQLQSQNGPGNTAMLDAQDNTTTMAAGVRNSTPRNTWCILQFFNYNSSIHQ